MIEWRKSSFLVDCFGPGKKQWLVEKHYLSQFVV